ncbi:MAG: protein kinase, partial [Acidobacteriota bacterium]
MDIIDPHALRDVFDRAAALPLAERAALLEQACRGNAALRREVERLLTADARFGTVFDTAASDSAESSQGPQPLTLAAGARLGPYLITAPLGAGGMGEVYRADDTRLERPVAIKVLRRGLTADPTARHRFEREARAIAALSHAHICPLFDIGHQDGTDYLVMEYLDGETLAARLARGRIPLDQALAYGSDIAHALAAAHQAGIVHRDLKPGNIMVTSAGIKLLDFGLAKRRPLAATEDATVAQSQPLTHSGLILGTVQYMAPEQLEGREADEHTDLFAFGVVLYEMVTGHKAFDGASTAALIGNILHAEPPSLSSYEALSPPALDEVVRVCLTKNPDERTLSLEEIATRLARARPEGAGNSSSMRRRRWLALGAAALLTAAIVGIVMVRERTASPPSTVAAAPAPRTLTRLTFDPGLQTDPTFSPDGRYIAYASDKAGNFDVWVQLVSGGNPVQITHSVAQDTEPAWSPDGNTIVFRSDRHGGGLYAVSALGGPERLLVNSGVHPSWSEDGKEVRFQTETFSQASARLNSVPVEGGEPHEVLPEFTRTGNWYWIAAHPDGHRFSFLGFRNGHSSLDFFTVSQDGTVTSSDIGKRLPPQLAQFANGISDTYGRRFQWVPHGRALLLETLDSAGITNLWRVNVDPATLKWASFDRLTAGPGADVHPAVQSDAARVAFSTVRNSMRLWQFPLARGHSAGEGRPLTPQEAEVAYAAVTPDGKSAAYNLRRVGSADPSTLWLMHLDTGQSEPLSSDGNNPRLSPDRQTVAYTRTITSKFAVTVRAVRGGMERLITPWSDTWLAANDWVPDQTAVLVSHGALETWPVTGPTGNKPSRIVFRVPDANLFQAKFSPNARWLACVVVRNTGGVELGVTSIDGPPDRTWIPIGVN